MPLGSLRRPSVVGVVARSVVPGGDPVLGQLVVVLRCELGRLGVGAREERKEAFEAVRAQRHTGWELPEDGAELGAEREDTRREEVGERGLDVVELLEMRDVAAALDGEDEVVRSAA